MLIFPQLKISYSVRILQWSLLHPNPPFHWLRASYVIASLAIGFATKDQM